MKKRFVLAFLFLLVVLIGVAPPGFAETAEQPTDAIDVETYMTKVPAENVAYCNFYGDLDSRYASFHDGISLGIKETKDPLYFELVNLDGYEGRKQYSGNSVYIDVDDSFYDKGDTRYLVNIFYYDFGPSEGTYYLEYRTTGGVVTQKKITKPGNYPGWTYITLVLTDCDMSPHYENGASLRIQNGAYNAWRRVEIVNMSDYVSEKKSLEGVDHLGLAKRRDLEKAKILPDNDPILMPTLLAKPCTLYDAKRYINIATMSDTEIPEADKEKTLTQAELLKMFMDVLEIDYSGQQSIVDYAFLIGLADDDGLFLFDEAQAINYNLGTLFYDFVVYDANKREPYIFKMYKNGFYGDLALDQINNDVLVAAYYAEPRKNPYITITDSGSGKTFKYINFFGEMLKRPYLTSPQWIHDGKRFICQTNGGYIYMYDTETQMMHFVAQSGFAAAPGSSVDGTVGEDNMIYYIGKEGSMYTLEKVDPDDPELVSKTIYRFPGGTRLANITVSKDGTWFSGDLADNGNYFKAPDGYNALVIFHVPEESKPGVPDETYQVGYYRFPESEQYKKGPRNHIQANPTYPNLVFFAHETNDTLVTYNDTRDRSNIMDLNTGKVVTYNQGYMRNGKAFDLTTHESFSADGEWLTGVTWVADGSQGGSLMGQTGQMNRSSIFKMRVDGTHRQVYYADDYANQYNHAFFSEDMKFAIGDSGYISIMSLDTHQIIPITSWSRNTLTGHPYHAHAQIARGHYIASWGHTYKGVLGVAWYDFSNEVENEIAKGGRYEVNEYVSCVSYEGLECESEKVKYGGRDCQAVKAGKGIYYEINPEIADTTNDAIRITFDYYDNDKNPLVITYTGGVRTANDDRIRFDKQIQVARKGKGGWKTAVVEIEEANCENVGKYETDFIISGGSAKTYISNVKVEAMETYYKYENNFTDVGGSAILADPSVIYERKDK